MRAFKRYERVEPGSRVQVSIDPCAGKTVDSAKLISSTDVLTWRPCSEPTPDHRLEAGRNYFIGVRLVFVAASQVEVTIRVRRPGDGGIHSDPWKWRITGTAGDVALVGGFIEVEGGEA